MTKSRIVFTLLLCLGLGSCSLGGPSRPSSFYVLSPIPGEPVPARAAGGTPLSVGVGPVDLPDIFARPQIVTRQTSNRIDLNEFNRWGGDLTENLVRVLSQNLMERLNTENVVDFPWQRRDNPDFQITVRFYRFDGLLGDEVTLSGIWQLLDGGQGCQLQAHRFDIVEKPAGHEYADLVGALSVGVARLSETIAEHVATATPGCKPEN